MYAEERIYETFGVYHLARGYRLQGRLDLDRLHTALTVLTERQRVLRTGFLLRDGVLWQEIHPEAVTDLRYEDLRSTPPNQQEDLARQRAGEVAAEPINLDKAPLWRAHALELAEETWLVLTVHHIIIDGWSLPFLWQELVDVYETGEAAGPPPPTQFADFVAAEHVRAAPERNLRYWHDQLAGALPLTLPTDRPRAPVRSFVGAQYRFDLPTQLVARLSETNKQAGTTDFMAYLTAYVATLSHFAATDDLVIGMPIANRVHPDTERMLGYLVNIVPVRFRIQDTTLTGLAKQIRLRVIDALVHQDYSPDQLIRRLAVRRDPVRNPLYQVMFSLEAADEETPPPFRSIGAAPLKLPAFPAARAELSLTIVEGESAITGVVEYRTDLFDETTVANLADAFRSMLTTLADAPDTEILQRTMPRDQQIALEQGPLATRTAVVPQLVAERCAATPMALAIASDDDRVTYGELDSRARTLADRIRPLLTGPEPVVALHLGRGPDLVVAMLAAWWAGAAFCPLDPSYPTSRIEYILTDLDACVLLTDDPDTGARLAGPRPFLTFKSPFAMSPPTGPPHSLGPQSLAYVLYTSGSTGSPKGVEVTHGNLANLIAWEIERLRLTADDRMSQIHSVGFDATQWEVWPALCAGATLLPYSRPTTLLPDLVRWFNDAAVTIAKTPTPVAEAIWSLKVDLPRLRWMLFGGSALFQQPPSTTGYAIGQAYGPTEATVLTSFHQMTGASSPARCIGTPITGTGLHVLNAQGERCPIGEPGEIVISGLGVARGYRGLPDLTAERFRPLSLPGLPPETIGYRTGDCGRWLADGTLEYLDRLDRQLKIRGYRIEPAEIETALSRHPAVQQAFVCASPDTGTSIVAYVTPAGVRRPGIEVLTDMLRADLPEYMIPQAIVWLEALPLNLHGKINATALPRPGRTDLVGQATLVGPRTDRERQLAALWRKTLGLSEVSLHDNFFDLGGNSLLVVQLHRDLREELGIELPVHRLFEYPTISALVHALNVGLAESPTGTSTAELKERAQRGRMARQGRRSPGR